MQTALHPFDTPHLRCLSRTNLSQGPGARAKQYCDARRESLRAPIARLQNASSNQQHVSPIQRGPPTDVDDGHATAAVVLLTIHELVPAEWAVFRHGRLPKIIHEQLRTAKPKHVHAASPLGIDEGTRTLGTHP